MRTVPAALLLLGVLVLPAVAQEQDIGGVEYRRLETRAATEARMLELLPPRDLEWGDWWLCGPFSYAGHGQGDLARREAPELELPRLAAGGPGPDLEAEFPGKGGATARWRPLGDIGDRAVNLRVFGDSALEENAAAYLWGTVRSDDQRFVEWTLGSDDGLRLWINGRLVVDHDVPRSLDPEAERVRVVLQPGVNHLLAKVANGGGDWAFQINTRPPLDPRVAAALQYRLDRDFPPHAAARFWRLLTVPVPDGLVLEVGGLDLLPDGRPIACTRRGEVWIVDGAYEEPPLDARFSLFAEGLHEPLGLEVRVEPLGVAIPDGPSPEEEVTAVYVVQRPELTRLVDLDGDGRADLFQTICDRWGLSGNYHEFAFGPVFDEEGNAWVTLNLGFCGSLGKSLVPWRGWAVKIAPDGSLTPVCGGLRSPNGLGAWHDGAMFYLDNQGDWVGTNKLSWLRPGSFQGHPGGLRWRAGWQQGDPMPEPEPPAVWFPYRKMGQSAADFAVDTSAGTFGPFAGQVFVGDQTLATVMRVSLEHVGGGYQGACYPFFRGLESGVNRLAFAADGSLFAGMTDRGWASVGPRRYGLQRLVWSGTTPLELREMRAAPDGFVLEFTLPVDAATVPAAEDWRLLSFTYEHHAEYGSEEMDTKRLRVLRVEPVDARTLHLTVAGLREGYVHELHLPALRTPEEGGNLELLHRAAWYTLQRIPGQGG